MAKPRRIELENGVVLLQGFKTAEADELEAYLRMYKQPVAGSTAVVEAQVEMPDVALGLRQKSPGQWETVVVKYNSDSKDAKVDSAEPAGDFKAQAVSSFRSKAVKLGLI